MTLRPPTPEEWAVVHGAVSSPLLLLTERKWTVRTATRGELVLREAYEVPLVDPTIRQLTEDRAARPRAVIGVPLVRSESGHAQAAP
jgi:hypothetical protein